MRKFLAISIACVMMILSLTALAASPGHGGNGGGGGSRPAITPAPATPRPTATVTPEVTLAPGETPTPAPSGEPGEPTPEVTEAPGEATPVPTVEPLVTPPAIVTPNGDTGIPSDGFLDVVEIDGGLDNETEYNDPTNEIGSLIDDGFSEYVSYKVVASDNVKDEINNDPDKRLKIVVNADIDTTKEFTVMVNYGDGWYAVSPDDVVVNGDGTITLTLDKIGAVSFFVKNDGTIGTDDGANKPGSKDTPSAQADYTVDKNVDYTVVSPQTGYLDVWEVTYGIPMALN